MKSRLKRFTYGATSVVVAIAMIPQITYANAPSNWAKTEVNKAIELELVPVSIQGEYKKNITREEFSELSVKLYEALVRKEVTFDVDNPFTDTQNPYVIVANKLGIVNGKGNGEFAPYENVTREDMSLLIYRTLKAAKPNYNYSNKNEYIFEDYNLISSWTREAVSYLYGTELVNGVGDNKFDPKGFTSREESIVIVSRLQAKVIEAERASKNGLTISRSSFGRQENPVKQGIEQKLKTILAGEMGKPYRYGAAGPNSYDCSGLVYSVYGRLGISLPRTSQTQAGAGTYVAKKDLQYGDLVFFARNGRTINHVGIYVGDGKMVHSPQTGDVVKVTTITSGYYANGYYTARRVLP